GKVPCLLDRAKDAVVVDGYRGRGSAADERSQDERRHVAAAVSVVTACAFVEEDEDDAVPQLGAPEKRWEPAPKPGVADAHRAAVHVVAEIRQHEREVRQPAPWDVACERRAGNE